MIPFASLLKQDGCKSQVAVSGCHCQSRTLVLILAKDAAFIVQEELSQFDVTLSSSIHQWSHALEALASVDFNLALGVVQEGLDCRNISALKRIDKGSLVLSVTTS